MIKNVGRFMDVLEPWKVLGVSTGIGSMHRRMWR